MSSIIGFFDGNNLRAANLEGLLVQNKQTNYWQMKHGKKTMPFPHTILSFKDRYTVFTIHCIASQHVSSQYLTPKPLYHCPGERRGKIVVYMSGVNVHSIQFDGFLFQNDDGNWGLRDPKDNPMPLGIAFKNANCRLIEMEIESVYTSMPSILNCQRKIIYP